MIKRDLALYFAMYMCTGYMNQNDYTGIGYELLQPITNTELQNRQSKRPYLENNEANGQKRIKNSNEDPVKDSLASRTANNDLSIFGSFPNANLDQPDLYNLGDTVYTHSTFDQSCNMDPMKLQYNITQIGGEMTSNTATRNSTASNQDQFDTIQTMIAEPEFAYEQNIEERKYTLLGDQSDAYISSNAVQNHSTFDQSYCINPMQLQYDMTQIPGSNMSSKNAFSDLVAPIYDRFDTIQTETAKPVSTQGLNEEYMYNFLINQLGSSRDYNAEHHNRADTCTIIEREIPDALYVNQLESNITRADYNIHAYQDSNMPVSSNVFYDSHGLDHTFTNNNCPLPSNTCSSQNTTLDIEGELDRVQNNTIGGQVQNDEKMTCPTTLTLSFLSFRLFQTNKSLSTDQNNVINGKEVDLDKIDGTSRPSCKEQQHDVSNFVYNCKINLDENEINFGITGLTRNQLYAITNDRQNSDKTMYTFAETDIDITKYFQNLLDFLEGLDVSRYSCLNMQELYLTVIAYKCLEYNHNLKCFVLKDFLRWIHIYMSEFYFYVMLRLEKLDQGDIEAIKNIYEYKNYMKDELKHIVTIIAIFTSIDQLDAETEPTSTMIGSIYYHVDQFRLHILKFMESYHSTEITTSLYYLAVHMRNTKLANKSLNKNIVETQANTRKVSNHEKNVRMVEKKQNRQLKRSEDINFEYYHKLHHASIPKNMVYILACTLNPLNNSIFMHDLKTIKDLRFERKPNMNPTQIIFRYVLSASNSNKTIENFVITIFQFLELVREPKYGIENATLNLKRRLIGELLVITPKTYQERKRNHNYKAQKLVLFHKLIQMAMGIREWD